MQSSKNHSDFPYFARVALSLVGVTCFLLLLYWGKLILIPLFLAFLAAIVLYPLTRLLERNHVGKIPAAGLSVLAFLMLVVLVSYFFTSQFLQFIKALPDLRMKLEDVINRGQTWLSQKYHVNSQPEAGALDSSLNKIVLVAGNTISIVLETLVLFVLFVFFTFYILYHRVLLQNFMQSFFNQSHRKKIAEIVVELRVVINGYVKGLLIEMIIFITLSFLVLLILGVKYALLMAVFAGVLNLIPYLGVYTATAINALVTLASTNPTQGLEVAGVFIFVHIIDANIILPRIVGASVKINPFVTLIAVVVGNLIWGIPGMFLFIPLTAIIRVLGEKLKDFRSWAILIGEESKKE